MFSRFSIKFSIILTFLFLPIFLQTASGIEQHYHERKRNFPDKTESTTDVQLTIDVSSEIKQISKYIYGVNIANWCQWYYLNTCAQKLKDAKITVIRLGATNMERYNYRAGA